MQFITQHEIKARRAAEAAMLDGLKAQVAGMDAYPIIPGDQFHGGDMYEGFFAGKVVAQNRTHVPTRGIDEKDIPKARDIVAIHSWGSRLRRCVRLSKNYYWLDAFDDFIVAFQRTLSRDDLSSAGPSQDVFVLNSRGEVASWYRDLCPIG
jgi:hypothetical protein